MKMIRYTDLTPYEIELVDSIIQKGFSTEYTYVDWGNSMSKQINSYLESLLKEGKINRSAIHIPAKYIEERLKDFLRDNDFMRYDIYNSMDVRMPNGDELRKSGSLNEYFNQSVASYLKSIGNPLFLDDQTSFSGNDSVPKSWLSNNKEWLIGAIVSFTILVLSIIAHKHGLL